GRRGCSSRRGWSWPLSAPSVGGAVRCVVAGVGPRDGAGVGGDERGQGVGAGTSTVPVEQVEQLPAAGTAPRADVAGAGLGLLDEDVGVEGDPEEVVGGVARDQALAAPVVGQPGLVD